MIVLSVRLEWLDLGSADNLLYGYNSSNSDGWLLLILLKLDGYVFLVSRHYGIG